MQAMPTSLSCMVRFSAAALATESPLSDRLYDVWHDTQVAFRSSTMAGSIFCPGVWAKLNPRFLTHWTISRPFRSVPTGRVAGPDVGILSEMVVDPASAPLPAVPLPGLLW